MFSRAAATYFSKAVTFLRAAYIFSREAYIFLRAAVTFSLRFIVLNHTSYLLTSYLLLLTSTKSHFVCDSQFVPPLYMVVLTQKHPAHVAHVAPTLRVGWAT